MKEKFVMTSLLVGGIADIASTAACLSRPGFNEIGSFASKAMEAGNPAGAYIYKMAVTAVLIGLYAYSMEKPGKFTFSVDKAARIGNIISWGIAALNMVQLAASIK